MKLFYVLIILTIFCGCSFDNKSGIWDNSNISDKENKLFKDFKEVSISSDQFNEIISIKDNYKFKLSPPIKNLEWKDFFYNQYNNSKNFNYNTNNKSIFKSKKLSKFNTKKYILIENNNLILNDFKGNIIIYSINENKIISKFNFYKKKYKKIKKNLNLVVEKNIIYVSDNIGFLYAYNYKLDKVLWAKNFKKPFRSNIKIFSDKILASNEKNDLIIFSKKDGNILKKIPTEETIINNKFINNISTNNTDTIIFLNSFGSLYSVDSNSLNINWFINLTSSNELNLNNLFSGVEIVNDKKKLIVSSSTNTYVIDIKTGLIENKFNFSSLVRPIINNQYAFFITKNDLLIAVDLKNKKIIYSYNINNKIADFLNLKKKNVSFFAFRLVENSLMIFLTNSYVLNFKINGELKEIYKLPKKIHSEPVIIQGSLIYLEKKNKLILN